MLTRPFDEDYQDSGYASSCKESPTDEHHESHRTFTTQPPARYGEAQYGLSTQGPLSQPRSGAFRGSQQTTHEALSSATENRPYPPILIPESVAQPYGIKYNAETQYGSDVHQPYPNSYNAQPEYDSNVQQPYTNVHQGYGPQQNKIPYGTYEAEYGKSQGSYPNTQKAPYSVKDADVFFERASDMTDPLLYSRGIIAMARVRRRRERWSNSEFLWTKRIVTIADIAQVGGSLVECALR